MLPVNFVVTRKTIIFRTAPDTLLALYGNAQVSFEVDRFDEALHEGWSVLAQGHAHEVTDEREVKHLEDGTHLEPWAAVPRRIYTHRAVLHQRATRQPSRATLPVSGAEPQAKDAEILILCHEVAYFSLGPSPGHRRGPHAGGWPVMIAPQPVLPGRLLGCAVTVRCPVACRG